MGTQTIAFGKCKDQLEDEKYVNEDLNKKVHLATQGRHEFEIKLAEEYEKGGTM